MRREPLVELNNRGMVVLDAKRRGEFIEQPSAVMLYRRRPTVHGGARASHAREDTADTLVPEADAENWYAT